MQRERFMPAYKRRRLARASVGVDSRQDRALLARVVADAFAMGQRRMLAQLMAGQLP